MKHIKKVITLLLAVVMTLAMSSVAFAATGDLLDAAETTITAKELTAGDSVAYIQLVEWDATNTGWKLTANGTATGIALADLIDGISNEEAGIIADKLKDVAGTPMDTSGTTATATVSAGLYYLRAEPGTNNKDTIYNPAFVSADYYEGGNEIDFSSSQYSDTAVLKKSSNNFDKEVDDTNKYVSTKPGDIIPYKITTKIPTYGKAYTNPTFTISDDLSDGLTLEGDVKVTYGTANTTATNADVKITKDTSDGGGFTVEFLKDYLLNKDRGEVSVTIEYKAKVTTNAEANVTPMDNKAELVFSNKPSSTETKEDITRHYTYSIDGNLLGGGGEQTKELIKTGTDKNGQPITTETTYYKEKKAAPLDGASFTLYKADGTTVVATSSSTNGGYINFSGLEAGTYKLVETAAPTGYIKDSRTFTVEIIPHYNTTTGDLLESYDIKITAPESGNLPAVDATANFALTNDGTVVTSSAHGDDTGFINNTQGQELPSTGGIGTVIFYTIGSLLVIGCGIVLVSRRRMQKNK